MAESRTGAYVPVGRPVLLDLFCCAGGAAMGYYRAGFEVVGVDKEPQPHYPFEFHQGDALTLGRELLLSGRFAAVHASPPCQAYTALKSVSRKVHPELVEPTRALLAESGLPWIMENVPGAPLLAPLTLCGTEFGLRAQGRWLRRHRLFESNIDLWGAGGCNCQRRLIGGVYGGGSTRPTPDGRRSGWSFGAPGAAEVMGIDWMNRDELAQAIPPAYTQHLGEQLIAAVRAREVAA